jgi:hypothetical protein
MLTRLFGTTLPFYELVIFPKYKTRNSKTFCLEKWFFQTNLNGDAFFAGHDFPWAVD